MKKTPYYILLIVIVAVLIIIGKSIYGKNKQVDQEHILKIGFALPLSGDLSSFGEEFKRGAQVAANELNEKSEKVNVVFEDDALDTKKTIDAVSKLVSYDKVDAVVVSAYPEAAPSWRITDSARIPMMVLWDSNTALEAMGNYVFAIGPWTPASGEVTAQFEFNKGNKSASILAFNDEFATTVSDSFKKEFEKLGGTIESYQIINPGVRDYRTYINKATAKDPKALYVPHKDFGSLVKQIKEGGYTGEIITSDILDSETALANPELFEGVFTSQVADPDSKETDHYIHQYKKYYKEDPKKIVIGAWAYDSVMVYHDAFMKQERKEDLDKKESFVKSLYTTDYQGASGHIKFNPEGSSKTIPQMFVVKSGVITKVK